MTKTGIGPGNHPNSLKNLKPIQPGESRNPKGRPGGQTRIEILELLKPLIRVINDQQCRIDRQGGQISEHVKKLNKAEAELTEAFEIIERLNDVTDYENRIEQLQKENQALKAKAKELLWDLDCCQAREKEDWSWKDDAIKLDKELRQQRKDTKFWESSCKASNELLGMERTKPQSLNKEITDLKERQQNLLDELEPYRKAERQRREAKIGMQYAGRARR